MSETFKPRPEARQLTQEEMVEGVYQELTPQLEGMRSQIGRDVWRFTHAWLDEEDPDLKQRIYVEKLVPNIQAFVARIRQFMIIGESPEREDADYDLLLETTMRLAVALGISLDSLI